jgi:hypothetical protein
MVIVRDPDAVVVNRFVIRGLELEQEKASTR